MAKKNMKRRDFLRTIALGAFATGAVSCAPQIVEKTVEVEKVVQQTVVVEKEKQVEVKETVVVETYVGGLPVPREDAIVMSDTTIFRVFDSFNPFTPNQPTGAGWDQMVGARLMYVNWATGEDVNMLVEGYEYNSDYTTLTFKTRKEAMWNDGKPFTAKDIKFTVEMLKGNANLGWSSTMNQWVTSVDAPDDTTAVFTLTSANPRFHWNFKQAWSCPIVAEHEWTGQDPMTYKAFPPIGTGPYMFKQAIPELRMYVWEKVKDWWGISQGYKDGPTYVVWQTSPPPEAEIQDLADNYVDHAHSYTSDAKLLRRSQELNKDVVLAPWRDPCPRGIWFNCAKYPLSKPEVRTAMFHCIDKKKAAESLYPWPTIPALYPWADWGGNDKYDYKDLLEKYDADPETSFNVDKAAQILDDLGFRKGGDGTRVDDKGNKMEYTIIVPQVGVTGEYPIALDFAENLKKVGITATVKWNEMAVWDEALQNGTFDISSHWWCGNWQEPPQAFAEWQSDRIKPVGERATAGNWIRLDDPEMTDLAKQLENTAPDDPKITEIYKAAFEQFLKLMVSVPVIQTTF
ncbi:MAG: hypothetical protein IH586_04505, partial [Anaerolineaceae bacterium]|nr:hypothetical protein [Anaerolineaceae bacterium]